MLQSSVRNLVPSSRKILTEPHNEPPGVDQIRKNLIHRRKAAKRAFLDARRCKRAIEHLLQLPKPGESLHFVADGTFEPCDLIPATRRLSDPAIFRRLDITTLGLNNDNTRTIASGIDQGKVLQCSILVSHYFSRLEKEDYQFLKDEIQGRGGRVNAMRTHTKLILMEMDDGINWYTVEGSGNLRSCKSIEQFVMTNDKDLLLFHRKWIDEYINSRGDGKVSKPRIKK